MFFHCVVLEGGERLPTLSLVDYDTPGCASARTDYTHTFADRHRSSCSEDVRVPDTERLGAVGAATSSRTNGSSRSGSTSGPLQRRHGTGADAGGRMGDEPGAVASDRRLQGVFAWPTRLPTRRQPGS